jgi:hypothetical protein
LSFPSSASFNLAFISSFVVGLDKLGDFNLVSVSEVKMLAGGDGSGRVQR